MQQKNDWIGMKTAGFSNIVLHVHPQAAIGRCNKVNQVIKKKEKKKTMFGIR